VNADPEVGSFVTAGGISTNYHEMGDGPSVMMLHGSGPGVTAWANWRLNMPDIAKTFRVIAPDIVGFGYTDRPKDMRYDLDAWSDHALSILDALGIERAHVIGNSFGGGVALRLATRFPDRIDRLVLMGSAGLSFPLTEGLDCVWGYTPTVENMRRMMSYFAYDRSLINDDLIESRWRASLRQGVQDAYAALFPEPRQRWIEALCTNEDLIRAIQMQTLIIHGRDDRVVPVDCSERLHQMIGPSQLHVFGQCGHWTQIEHRQRFNQLVVNFLSE